ncbi:alpha/beta fold hydrolase [Paenibacillus sp. MMS20-IR301]|uniref:alpha/beta hydrolase n=1 Tax=Paenibacillus sp. MMS20-IR301 TaxID=2895946 RepID=UPI0028EEC7FF|nr:alpha/beta fold hydrolase [Paenibacillus sp. MMS20-IR301]WNS43224.1 alpha/beta fold hydrolase [Paenibacillus sp. MMS20-IR301]
MDSCLLIHGFTGGEYEVLPLAQFLGAHDYITRTFTLKGHGGTRRDLLHSDRHDWQQSAEEELNMLLSGAEGVHLVGFSTGALIASGLSVRYKPYIKSLTLLSAPVFPLNPAQILRTLGSPEMVRNYLRKWRSTPLKATREFQHLVRESFAVYPELELPTFIVQGNRDHLVKSKSAGYLQQTIPSRRKQVHMVCHSADSAGMMDEVLQFMRSAGDYR